MILLVNPNPAPATRNYYGHSRGMNANKEMIDHIQIMSQREDEIMQNHHVKRYQRESTCTNENSFKYDDQPAELKLFGSISQCHVQTHKNIVCDENVFESIDLSANLVQNQRRKLIPQVPNNHACQNAKTTTSADDYSRNNLILLNQIKKQSCHYLPSRNTETLTSCLQIRSSSGSHACDKIFGYVRSLSFLIGALPFLTMLLNVRVVEALNPPIPTSVFSPRGFRSHCPSSVPSPGKLYVRHPRICSVFYVCHKNHFWRLSCDKNNTIFSITHKVCVWQGSAFDDCHKAQNISRNEPLRGHESPIDGTPFGFALVKRRPERRSRGQEAFFVDEIPSNGTWSISGDISHTQNGEMSANFDEKLKSLNFLGTKDLVTKTKVDPERQNLKYISTATSKNAFIGKRNQTKFDTKENFDLSEMRQIKNNLHINRNTGIFQQKSKIITPEAQGRKRTERPWWKRLVSQEKNLNNVRTGEHEDYAGKGIKEYQVDLVNTLPVSLPKSIEIRWPPTRIGPDAISSQIVESGTQQTNKRKFKRRISSELIYSNDYVSDPEDIIQFSSGASHERTDETGLWWVHPKKEGFQEERVRTTVDHTDSQHKGPGFFLLGMAKNLPGGQKHLYLTQQQFSNRKQEFENKEVQDRDDIGKMFLSTETYKNVENSGREIISPLPMNDSFHSRRSSAKESHFDVQNNDTHFLPSRHKPVPFNESKRPSLDASHNPRLLDQFLEFLRITTPTTNIFHYHQESPKVLDHTAHNEAHLKTLEPPENNLKRNLRLPKFGNEKPDVPRLDGMRESGKLRQGFLDTPWDVSSIHQPDADSPSRDHPLQSFNHARGKNKLYDRRLTEESPKFSRHQKQIMKVRKMIPEYPRKLRVPKPDKPFEIEQQQLQNSRKEYDASRFPSWLQGLNRKPISQQKPSFTSHPQLDDKPRRIRPLLFQIPNISNHKTTHESFRRVKAKQHIPQRLKNEKDNEKKLRNTQIPRPIRNMHFSTTERPLQSLNLSKRPSWYRTENKSDNRRRRNRFDSKKQRSQQPKSEQGESYMDRYIRWKEQLREQERKRRERQSHLTRIQRQPRNRNPSKQFQYKKSRVQISGPLPERKRLGRSQNKKHPQKWYDHHQKESRKNRHENSYERSPDSKRSRFEKRNRPKLILNRQNKPTIYRYRNNQNHQSHDLKLKIWDKLQFPKWSYIRDQGYPSQRQCFHQRKHNDQQSVITPARNYIYTSATPPTLKLTDDPTTTTTTATVPSQLMSDPTGSTVIGAFIVSTGTVTETTIRVPPPPPEPTTSEDGPRSFYEKGPDDRCGIMARPLIIGGRRSRPGQWPWQASLQIVTSTTPWHRCGAVLVHERWVLTAAHCMEGPFYGDIRNWRVVMADYDLEIESGHEIYRQVVRIVSHPGYVRVSNFPNDVALLELDRPVDITSGEVQTACLPDETMSLAAGTQCWISGWGETRGSGGRENAMNEVPVEVVSLDRCKAMWGRVDIEVLDSQVCLGTGEIGACYGDSGGPLMCERDGRFYVSGVMSWLINNCSAHNFPNVFTRLPSYMDWVSDQLDFYAGYRAIKQPRFTVQ